MSVTTINGGTQIRDATVTPAKVTAGIIKADGTNAFTGAQSMGGFKLTNVDTPTVSTDAANKAYVDAAVVGLLDFKGATDCSGNPNYPAALKGDAYVVSVAGKIGGASGTVVAVGDWFVAEADNAGGTEASVGASWGHLEHQLAGALLAANNLSDLQDAATAVNNLGGASSTGTGGLVRRTGAALVTPLLGQPASGDLSNCTTNTLPGGTNTTQLASTAFVQAAIGAIPAAATYVCRETPAGTVNGSNVTFTMAFAPVSGTESIYVNGILQDSGAGNDYTIAGATITFLAGSIPQTGDKVRVTYFK